MTYSLSLGTGFVVRGWIDEGELILQVTGRCAGSGVDFHSDQIGKTEIDALQDFVAYLKNKEGQ
jgi:hypothetical protein